MLVRWLFQLNYIFTNLVLGHLHGVSFFVGVFRRNTYNTILCKNVLTEIEIFSTSPIYLCPMKLWLKKYGFAVFLFLFLIMISSVAEAQCSICTKTAAQLGEKPARGLNAGILYLASMPLAIMGFIGYKWWKRNTD
jgi:hypothetical protein